VPAMVLATIARKGGGQLRHTQGFGVFFCCSKEMCTGYKKHDKLVAIAGRQARKL